MYESRRAEKIDPRKADIEILKNEISKLKDEIDEMNIEDIDTGCMSDVEDLIKLLQAENGSLEQFLEHEQKRKVELQKELEALSGYVEEEEQVKAAVKEYMKEEGKFQMEAAHDEVKALHHQSKALILRLTSLIKSFAHNYDCDDNQPTDQPRSSKRVKRAHPESEDQKSLVDILKLLIPDLSPYKSDRGVDDELEIDETISDKHIEFLLSANIIERCEDNPNRVRLVQPLSTM